MRIIFYTSNKMREKKLAKAFKVGAAVHGYTVEVRRNSDITTECDLACMVGVKSRKLWSTLRGHGVNTIMFDKGYNRHKKDGCWEYWRIAYNAHGPTDHTLNNRYYSNDRFKKTGFLVKPWREKGKHILIAGSSAKYHNFFDLIEPTAFANSLVNRLRVLTDRPIIYRPKPSWRGAEEIEHTTYSWSKQPLIDILEDCHAVVTHGSNTCFDAALAGVPSIIIGDGVTRSISSTRLSDIENPKLGSRERLFNALGYHQWSLAEFYSGEAFKTIGKWL